MCIICVKPASKKIKKEIWEECWRVNNDGVGIAYVDQDKQELVVEKGFMNMKDAIDAIQAKENHHLLVHFRRVSRGGISKDNCHPFIIHTHPIEPEEVAEDKPEEKKEGKDKDAKKNFRFTWVIAHNGTLPYGSTANKSDTRCFAEEWCHQHLQRDPWMFDSWTGVWVFEKAIESKNKVVVWRYDNIEKELTTYILNKNASETNESMGCWWSNYSWMPIPDEYYGGMGMGNFRNHSHHQGGGSENFSQSNTCSEGYADHAGWFWDATIQKFRNVETPGLLDALTYRKPMEDEYEYYDIHKTKMEKFSRLKMGKKSTAYPNHTAGGHRVISPTQTTIAPLTPVLKLTSGDRAELGKDGNINVPRDEDDEFFKDYNFQEAMRGGSLRHLKKGEIKRLKKTCTDFIRDTYGKDMVRDLKPMEIIKFVRHEFRTNNAAQTAGMNLYSLDMAIIDHNAGVMPTATHDSSL